MINIDMDLHSSCKKTFLLAIVAVFCISEFNGIFWIDVNPHVSCQMTFLMAIVAVFLHFGIHWDILD